MAGCVPVGIKMLESYLKYHDEENRINVYLFIDDLETAGIDERIFLKQSKYISLHALPENLKEDFLHGHQGTAKVWSRVIMQNPDAYLIHIDSDIIFKKESISLIGKAGYPDIYGSRRCYQNNPGKAPVKEGLEDAVSTYFLGFNPKFIMEPVGHESLVPNQNSLEPMIQGIYNPLAFPCLDFFDPVFFWMRYKGASVYFEDVNIIGGQNTQGTKINSYKSNLHLDMGSHMAHFGGVGSGYQFEKHSSDLKTERGYSEWALIRWYLFEDLFYGFGNILYSIDSDPVYLDNRWVGGGYNYVILNQIKEDLLN